MLCVCCRLEEHHDWVQEQLANPDQHPPHERQFWQGLAMVMEQFLGMQLGYEARLQEVGPNQGLQNIPWYEWLTLNTMGKLLMPWIG
jgi:hypothetical protein